MREPPDLRELVGGEVSPEELAELGRADALLRRVPAPPAEVPQTLTQSVARVPLEAGPPWTRRRVGAVVALAAALAALAFGAGRWTTGDDFDTRFTVAMEPTEHAPGAQALIAVGERDEATGNWELELDVSGLPRLGPDEYYVLCSPGTASMRPPAADSPSGAGRRRSA